MSEIQTYILYFSIIIFTSIFALLIGRVKEENFNKVVFFIIFLVPALISGLRYGVGTDYFNYYNIYFDLTLSDNLAYELGNTRYEPGWVILNYMVKFIFDDVIYIFIISSLMIWLFSFKALYENRKHINLGIAVLVLLCTMYNPSFNLIRLYMAASILMLTIKPIIEKKLLKFLLLVLFAASFHYSALIFLPVYWLINSKYRVVGFVKRGMALVFTILLILFADAILSSLTNFELFSTYERYEIQYDGLGLGVIIVDLPIIVLIALSMYKMKKSGNPMYHLSIVYFIGIILSFFSYLADYAGRISTYFELMQIFIVAAIVKVETNIYKKAIYILFITSYYLGLYVYYYVINNSHETVPYIWIP